MNHDFNANSDTARREAQNGEDSLSPLEQEVLDEYAKLVGNLDDVRDKDLPSNSADIRLTDRLFFGQKQLAGLLAELAANPSAEILDSLRGLERKTTTVFTLLKASVYSIVLQQEIADADGR